MQIPWLPGRGRRARTLHRRTGPFHKPDRVLRQPPFTHARYPRPEGSRAQRRSLNSCPRRRRLQELDRELAGDDGPIFATVAKLIETPKSSLPDGLENAERKKEALRLARELLRGTKQKRNEEPSALQARVNRAVRERSLEYQAPRSRKSAPPPSGRAQATSRYPYALSATSRPSAPCRPAAP